MTYPEAVNTVKYWLINEKKVSNMRIAELVNGDNDMQRLVLASLLAQGIAEDDGNLGLNWTGLHMPSQKVSYDVFVSYSRKDNANGRVNEIVNELGKRYLNATGKALNIFFDRPELKSGELWWEKIKEAIHHSKVFIAVLSPNYLKSEVCEKEWREFLEHQSDWHKTDEELPAGHDSIVPAYVIKMPEMLSARSEDLNDWQQDIFKRNLLDLSDWFEVGQAALERDEIWALFEEMSNRCYVKLQEAEQLRNIKGNIPRFFKEHVPRVRLIQQISESLQKSEYPVTALHGLPGMGKSLLAFAYAKTYPLRYPGGCWYIKASGNLNVRRALIDIARLEWELPFTDEEKKDEELAWHRVKHHLEAQLAEKPAYLTLLIFDNVDEPTQSFSDAKINANFIKGTHIIITSRKQDLTQRQAEWIPVGGLSENEGLYMLGKYRPVNTMTEREDALAIVGQLSGFALALAVVGVQLGINSAASFGQILSYLKENEIDFLDHTGAGIANLPGDYNQLSTSKLFEPLLNGLSAEETRVLDYAALLPADSVALPWLEELLEKEFPNSFPEPKYADLSGWGKLVRKLKSISLITDGGSEHLVRMHRVLQDVIKYKRDAELEKIEEKLQDFSAEVAAKLIENTHVKATQWNISVLIAYAQLSLYKHEHSGGFLNDIAMIEQYQGNYATAFEWMVKAIAVEEKKYGLSHPTLGIRYSNMGVIKQYQGQYLDAQKWMEKSISIFEKYYRFDNPYFGMCYSNMATIERNLGNYESARDWLKKAIEIDEINYDPYHPLLGTRYSNMATIEHYSGNYKLALEWLEKAKVIHEKNYEPHHPTLGILYSNIAMAEKGLGNKTAARDWMEKSVIIFEKNYRVGHPLVGSAYSNFAILELESGNREAACMLWLKAYWIIHNGLGEKHPDASLIMRFLQQYCPECFENNGGQ